MAPDEIERVLGVTNAEVRAVLRAPSFDAALAALDELRARARKNLRKAALELHPDVTGGDEKKNEQLKVLTAAYEGLKNLKLVQRPLVVRPPVYVVWSSAATDTSTTASAGWHMGWHVRWTAI